MWNRQTISWAFYDFANSAFVTLVVTFIYAAFFAREIAIDPDRGTILWARAVNISAVLVAVSMPFVGAIADAGGLKRRFLAIATFICAGGTFALAFPQKGDVFFALSAFVIANVAFESCLVLYNAFLPEVSEPETIGRVSGWGQGLGYAGGLICLVIALFVVRSGGVEMVPWTNGIASVWVIVFALPMLLFVRDQNRGTGSSGDAVRNAWRELRRTFSEIKRYRNAFWLIIARAIYNDGLGTVFAFASIFAAIVFDLTTAELITLGIGLNVASGIGSWIFGPIHDRFGGKLTIIITLIGLIVATLFGAFAEDYRWFIVAASLLGVMIGPNQAASRGLLSELIPEEKQGEFFGFFALSGKATAPLGPFVYGTVLTLWGSQRAAMASVIIFFVIGLILLIPVRDERKLARKDG